MIDPKTHIQSFKHTYRCVHCGFESRVIVTGVGVAWDRSFREPAYSIAYDNAPKDALLTVKLCPCPKCGARDSLKFILSAAGMTLFLLLAVWGIGLLPLAIDYAIKGRYLADDVRLAFWISGPLGIVSAGIFYYAVYHWKWVSAPQRVRFLPQDSPPDPLQPAPDFSASLPDYILPGHGFLVLRDLFADRLVVDGLDLGDPRSATHPHFSGSFSGFFNVPFGLHTLTAYCQEKQSTWQVELRPDDAQARRINWARGGWVDDDAETECHDKDLALSELMLTKALRPWPFCCIFFRNPPADLTLDGKPVPGPDRFRGVVGLLPGKHHVEAGRFSVGLELPREGMQLIDYTNGEPDFIKPESAGAIVRGELLQAPRGALIPQQDLRTSRAHDLRVINRETSIIRDITADLKDGQSGQKEVHIFNDADLQDLREAFEAYQDKPIEATFRNYSEMLWKHYIRDSEMANQADYFLNYAEEVLREVGLAPELSQSSVETYLKYLARDLQDTEDERLAAKGRELQSLLTRPGL